MIAVFVTGVALAEDAKEGAEPKEAVKVSVEAPGGGVTIKYGETSLNFGAWGQFRWTGDDREDFDGDGSGSGVGHEDGFSSSFSIPRIRLYLQGTVYRSWIVYRFEYEFSNTNTDGANKVKDAYAEVSRYRMAAVRVGQYKVPFSIQEITSDTRQEFIERAITNNKFASGRDQGLMLWGATADKRFGYQAAVFNGGGEGRSQDDEQLMSVARVWTAPFGEYKLSEGPLENTDRFILEAGAAYRTGEASRGTATPGVTEDVDDESAWNAEACARFWRLYGTAEYFQMTDELDNPVDAPAVHSRGYHAQVGFMAIPKHLEFAFRYAEINPDTDAVSANVTERRLAAAWYVVGHSVKLLADGGRISYGSGFAGLSAIAKRGLPPLGARLSSGTVFQDEQYRVQAQIVF